MNDLERLRQLAGQIDELLAIRESTTAFTESIKINIQQQFKKLKEDMRAEGKAGSKISSIVNEALSRIQVATNAHPQNPRWYSDLYAARIDLRYAMDQYFSEPAEKPDSET